MRERLNRGIPPYVAEAHDGSEFFPANPWDHPVLVDLQSIALHAATRPLTATQRADAIIQVARRASYLRAASAAAEAIVRDLCAHLNVAPAAPDPGLGSDPAAAVAAGEPFAGEGSSDPIEAAPAGVAGDEPSNPADLTPKPRHRPRNLRS